MNLQPYLQNQLSFTSQNNTYCATIANLMPSSDHIESGKGVDSTTIVEFPRFLELRKKSTSAERLVNMHSIPAFACNLALKPHQISGQYLRKIQNFSTREIVINNCRWILDRVIAKGRYGIAVRVKDLQHRYCVLKVDKDGHSVEWEAVMYDVVSVLLS